MRRLASILVLSLALASCGSDTHGPNARGPAAPSERTAGDGSRFVPDFVPAPTRTPARVADATPSPAPTPTPTPISTPTEIRPRGLPDGLAGTEWYVLPTERRVVALTFDCGANADGIPSILGTLTRKRAPATFFLTGRWAETFAQDASLVGSSYSVGNHTYNHPDLTELERVEVRKEILKGQRRIIQHAGVDPRPLFRFPYGASDTRRVRVVNRLGYGSIRWTIDTLGWKGATEGITERSIIRRVLDGLRPGAIVLMHVGSAPDGSTLDADALPRVIRKIREAGYRFVRLDRFVSTLEDD